MGKPFDNKTTFSLLKTNPKLTGNVKLVVDSNENLFIETIDGTPELSRNKYKNKKINKNSSWENDVYSLFSDGKIPLDLFYSIKNIQEPSISGDFSFQYYTEYQKGVKYCFSKFYKEHKGYFVPTWFEPNNIPEYFAIIKVPKPVSVNTSKLSTNHDDLLDSQIYNANYNKIENLSQSGYLEQESDYFFQTILKDSKILKVFSLKEGSSLGDYLRNYLKNSNFPESSLTVNWQKDSQSTVNGISLRKSGFTKESFDLYTDGFVADRGVLDFDEIVTNKFSENGVVHPNIINLEFLFDDNDNDWEVNRYVGIYFNEEELSKFKLNPELFWDKRTENIEQSNNIQKKNFIEIDKNQNFKLTNKKGIKLFCDYPIDEYKVLGTDLKNRQFIPYIKSVNKTIFNINTVSDWNENEVIIKNTEVDLKSFIGFEENEVGYISSAITNKQGRSYFKLKLTSVVDNLEVRIRENENINIPLDDLEFKGNNIFVGTSGLDKGTFVNNSFSLNGTVFDILSSLSSCINNFSDKDEDFNIFSLVKDNEIIIFTRGTNEYWNKYKFLVFSSSQNAFNFITINNENGTEVPQDFKDYNKLIDDNYVYSSNNNLFYYSSNFKGGNNSENNRIRIKKEDIDFFNTNLYLKTKTWYSKIISICDYLDEPIFKNGKIIDFNNYSDYNSVNIDDEIFIFDGSFVKLFTLGFNTINLMSMYPVKVLDTDMFSKEYSKKIDGIDIDEISLGKSLISLPIDFTGKVNLIDCEYDRLKENETPEYSSKSRLIPYVCKWVYDDFGKDVRDNDYRLNTNSAFSFDNFSPSIYKKSADYRYFTHEWYYLDKYPSGFSKEQKTNAFSYFNESLNVENLKSNTSDYFTDYFTDYYVQINETNKVHKKVQFKYNFFSGGNDDMYSTTFFRGSKIRVQKRTENSDLNFNKKVIKTVKNNFFNDYKFSAVLKHDAENAIKYEVIENRKFKNITFVISCDLSSDNISRDALYKLLDKTDVSDTLENILLSGKLIFTQNSITGTINNNNNSLPSFSNQINKIDNSFNDIRIKYKQDEQEYFVTVKGSSILSVDTNNIILKNGPEIYLSTSVDELGTLDTIINIQSLQNIYTYVNAVYIGGGKGYYKNILEQISFSSILEKVNQGSPEIIYTTIDNNGNLIKNDFVLDFETPVSESKNDYLKNSNLISSSLNTLGFGIIGNEIINSETIQVSPMFRYNGNYNPKVNDVIVYRNTKNLLGSFSETLREKLHLKNIEFFSTYDNFGIFKNLYNTKVNEIDPFGILPQSNNEPKFWRTGEIALDKSDMYIFRSNWDLGFYKRYINKTTFVKLPGYIEPTDVNNFFGTTIMNLKDEIFLENINESYVTVIRNDLSNITLDIDFKNYFREILKENIKNLFLEYVNPKFNFGNIDSLDDDIFRYIDRNILQKYSLDNIEVYIKYTTKNNNTELIESNKNKQQLLQTGFIKLTNFSTKIIEGTDFNIRFIYNKPVDKNITLSFFQKNKIV